MSINDEHFTTNRPPHTMPRAKKIPARGDERPGQWRHEDSLDDNLNAQRLYLFPRLWKFNNEISLSLTGKWNS
jgi:hypothetical protein